MSKSCKKIQEIYLAEFNPTQTIIIDIKNNCNLLIKACGKGKYTQNSIIYYFNFECCFELKKIDEEYKISNIKIINIVVEDEFSVSKSNQTDDYMYLYDITSESCSNTMEDLENEIYNSIKNIISNATIVENDKNKELSITFKLEDANDTNLNILDMKFNIRTNSFIQLIKKYAKYLIMTLLFIALLLVLKNIYKLCNKKH